jgi:very-short-patch-repair endonuclease
MKKIRTKNKKFYELKRLRKRNSSYVNQLRNKPTQAELLMKDILNELHVSFIFQKGFFTPFHRIVDFYIPKRKIIIEVDGGYHQNTQTKDMRKDMSFFDRRGFRTLRFTNEEVFFVDFKDKLEATLGKI